ncbi:TetR/AcrR family transcriptional regulator [Gordonia sp. CPCC 206044]|uniref:TetR/AcrR family transcriptional regulator n=1 Tax=Gordonia sp. CPCC 206044 TaxID=3140793 RepID=UPI003AF3D01D
MPASSPSNTNPTRTALLSAAETLFLAEGYDAVSVRAICAAAKANPAAVHYHFGSKDQLTIELLQARLAPIWAEALDRFDPEFSDVRDLVDVVLRPFVEIQNDPHGRLHLRLLGRFVLGHPDATWTDPWFRLDRWSGVLATLVPGLSADDARRRWALAFQLILARFGDDRRLSASAVHALSDFVVAGLCAPATQPTEQENE